MRIQITASEPIAVALAAVSEQYEVKITDAFNKGFLSLDNSSPKTVTIGLPSLKEIASLASRLWAKLRSAMGEKPEGSIVVQGPGGKVEVKLKGISEAALLDTIRSVLTAQSNVKS